MGRPDYELGGPIDGKEDEPMAYSDYGAFVWCNGKRRKDKEDAPLFATDEETFGKDIHEIPSGARIWASLVHAKSNGRELDWLTHIHHGILGDGAIRVLCHKQGLPQIYELTETGPVEVQYYDRTEIDEYEYQPFFFHYKGYQFRFEHGSHYEVVMNEPDGSKWECEYDYEFGAGFEDE